MKPVMTHKTPEHPDTQTPLTPLARPDNTQRRLSYSSSYPPKCDPSGKKHQRSKPHLGTYGPNLPFFLPCSRIHFPSALRHSWSMRSGKVRFEKMTFRNVYLPPLLLVPPGDYIPETRPPLRRRQAPYPQIRPQPVDTRSIPIPAEPSRSV